MVMECSDDSKANEKNMIQQRAYNMTPTESSICIHHVQLQQKRDKIFLYAFSVVSYTGIPDCSKIFFGGMNEIQSAEVIGNKPILEH